MNKEEMKRRTKALGVGIIRFVDSLPKGRTAEIIGRQLIRSGTSIGANYRSAHRARSKAEFIAKMGIVEEETDETLYWLELLIDAGFAEQQACRPLQNETDQILSIVVASINTARRNKQEK